MPSIPKGPTGKPARSGAHYEIDCGFRINLAKKLELEPLEGVPKDLWAFNWPFETST